ncbi:hypothetical protein DXG01_014610 [Tephrocybe rancida]|nr:hypothetical protein DXG01_014610 [Tephrocybe rancida]
MAFSHFNAPHPPRPRRFETIPREAFRYDSNYGPAFNSRIDPEQLKFEIARQNQRAILAEKARPPGLVAQTPKANVVKAKESESVTRPQAPPEPPRRELTDNTDSWVFVRSQASPNRSPSSAHSFSGSIFDQPIASTSSGVTSVHSVSAGPKLASIESWSSSSSNRSDVPPPPPPPPSKSPHPNMSSNPTPRTQSAAGQSSGDDRSQHTLSYVESIHEDAPKDSRDTRSQHIGKGRGPDTRGRSGFISNGQDLNDNGTQHATQLHGDDPDTQRQTANHAQEGRTHQLRGGLARPSSFPRPTRHTRFDSALGPPTESDARSVWATGSEIMAMDDPLAIQKQYSEQSWESPTEAAWRLQHKQEDKERGKLERQPRKLTKPSAFMRENRREGGKTRVKGFFSM